MNPLQQIPYHVRVVLYWVGYVLGSVAQILALVWAIVAAASPDVSMPLWLAITAAVVGLVTNQLNALAGFNTTDTRTMTITAPSDAPTTLSAETQVGSGRRGARRRGARGAATARVAAGVVLLALGLALLAVAIAHGAWAAT